MVSGFLRKIWPSITSRNKLIIRCRPILSAVIGLLILYILWLFFAFLPFARFAIHPFRLIAAEKNYLVVFQNNYELRPTGGFISAFGILTFKHGMPVSFNFEDVYGTVDDHDYIEPPSPLGRLLAHPTYAGHTFRDANFNPDFPSSAASMEEFLHKTRPFQKIDGVFAVDLGFVENWLMQVGPVKVNGDSFDSVHLLEQIEEMESGLDLHDLNSLASRKQGIKSLAKRLAFKSMLPWNLPRFFNALEKSFDEKHALAYFKDETLQKIVRSKDWGGILKPEPGEDFLAVVDANYGGGKSNRYIKRSIFYEIDLERGESSLDIRYDHAGEITLPLSTNYRGYVRAYVPGDHFAAQGGFQNAEFSGREGDLFYAGKTFEIPIRSNNTLHFGFNFPRSIFDELTYTLNILKQPGTFDDFYRVTVRVPVGMHIASDDFEVAENIAVFSGQLTRDVKLSFELEDDPYPPRAISQELNRLNELEIFWNEPVAAASLHVEDWSVRDSDIKNPVTDALTINSFRLNGGHLIIETTGMSLQPEERYILEISGVGDYSGNKIDKKTYTFFQRLK